MFLIGKLGDLLAFGDSSKTGLIINYSNAGFSTVKKQDYKSSTTMNNKITKITAHIN